jgi:hypothetical protein
MAEFEQIPRYNYTWQNSKFADVSFSGSFISQFINDKGYLTSADRVTPTGLNTQIQFNDSGAFGGVPVLIYDKETLRVTGSFSGSLIGIASTASYVIMAQTASYIDGGTF